MKASASATARATMGDMLHGQLSDDQACTDSAVEDTTSARLEPSMRSSSSELSQAGSLEPVQTMGSHLKGWQSMQKDIIRRGPLDLQVSSS